MIVRDSTIANFSKCFHTEQTGYFRNTFENVKFFNFNMLAANAASISDITYLNCDVEQTNVDGLEQLEASILSYIESSGDAVTKFIGGRISQMTTIPNRNAQIGSIVLFQGVDFIVMETTCDFTMVKILFLIAAYSMVLVAKMPINIRSRDGWPMKPITFLITARF